MFWTAVAYAYFAFLFMGGMVPDHQQQPEKITALLPAQNKPLHYLLGRDTKIGAQKRLRTERLLRITDQNPPDGLDR